MSLHQQLKDKLTDRSKVSGKLESLRKTAKQIVFTNGCFDILHPGHVDYLTQARDLGDFLILGLNTDASVKKLEKAPNRPINNEVARGLVLAGLASVDMIIYFDEATPYELIKEVQPDILVKGNDYQVEQIAGYDVVQAKGGKVVTIPLLSGYSTTAIIKKITG